MTGLPRAGVRARVSLSVLGLAIAALVWALLSSGAGVARGAGAHLRPIGVISAFGVEQAPILAEMHVTGHTDIDGLRFWPGPR